MILSDHFETTPSFTTVPGPERGSGGTSGKASENGPDDCRGRTSVNDYSTV